MHSADPEPRAPHPPSNDAAFAAATTGLVRAAQAGDPTAVEDLFARYLPRVRRIVAARLGQTLATLIEADDVVQEALLDTFRDLHAFRPTSEGAFRSWLARSVENTLRDQARHGRALRRGGGRARRFADLHTTLHTSRLVHGVPGPRAAAADGELDSQLERALLRQPPQQREVVVLRVLCGMSFAEIAAQLGLDSEAAARQRLSRALRAMRASLP